MMQRRPVLGTSSQPPHEPPLEVLLLIGVQILAILLNDVIVGSQEEAAGAGSRV